MQFSLFPYQESAARGVLGHLNKARSLYRDHKDVSAFALSACTGAGKTVIASAVIESLFFGADTFGEDPDPTAVVLWLTDDESLNTQTRNRIIQSSELHTDQLVPIDNPDFPEKLESQTVYFLNVHKLYDRSSSWSKSSNSRPWSLWDTITNTINDDQRTLYLILDEAHKGMKPSDKAKADTVEKSRSTTVLRLINGEGERPPVPIVWGISATPERFEAAMHGISRSKFSPVVVPPSDVQESGLLKDAILLGSPNEKGVFSTTLLGEAVDYTLEQSRRWETYCTSQGYTVVRPLLVIQVENAPSDTLLKELLATVRDKWPDLNEKNVRHVFSKHSDLTIAGWKVRYVDPAEVQDATHIRVLFAKDAVHTGWDCPRAEVLVSMRGGQDPTYITQLMGRMVRTPLAMRVPSDEILNTVTCLLPKFNEETTLQVVNALTSRSFDGDGTGTGAGTGPSVLRHPVKLSWNTAPEGETADTDPRKDSYVSSDVYAALEALPSETKPEPEPNPVKNLFALTMALSGDELREGSVDEATNHLFTVLDDILVSKKHKAEIAHRVEDILTVDISTKKVNLQDGTHKTTVDRIPADSRSIDASFSSAGRTSSRDLMNKYLVHLLEERYDDEEERIQEITDTKAEVAALFSVPSVKEELDSRARELVKEWIEDHSSSFRTLDDERQAEYARIKGRTGEPMATPIEVPTSRPVQSAENDGTPYKTADRHLLADKDGLFPYRFTSTWEDTVLETELGRTGKDRVIGWYRNPDRASVNALQIPYQDSSGAWTTAQPDFIFFQRKTDGTIIASVIDPHGTHLKDGIERLRGFVKFLERYPGFFAAFESVAQTKDGKLVKLDLMDDDTRAAILKDGTSDTELFNGTHALAYK
jgi:type III restriction enzyme